MPYQGCSGGLVSYHYHLDQPLQSLYSQTDSHLIHGKLFAKACGKTLDLTTENRAICEVYNAAHGSYNQYRNVGAIWILTPNEMQQIDTWLTEKQQTVNLDNSQIIYLFAPTSLGTVTKICFETGENFDFSDYDSW
jgi:hypothetical protein